MADAIVMTMTVAIMAIPVKHVILWPREESGRLQTYRTSLTGIMKLQDCDSTWSFLTPLQLPSVSLTYRYRNIF